MPNPILDFIAYGPAGMLKRKRRDDARRRASDLVERQALAAKHVVNDAGFILDVPGANFDARDELDLSLALKDAGLDEKSIADAREQQARTRSFLDLAARLREGGDSPGIAREADFVNKKTLAPVGMQGGVAFDRFNPEAPILGESDAVRQLAAQRRAMAEETEMRTGHLRRVLENPDITPLAGADIANERPVYKPQRVKVRRADGSEAYMDAVPLPTGGYDYRPATDATGEAVRPPVGSADRGTALQRDTAFISETLGLKPEEAILWKLNSKTKGDQALWEEIVLSVARSDPYGRLKQDARSQKARELWETARPGRPPPIDAPAASPSPPSSGAFLSDEEDEDAAFDAEQAASAYATPEEVKAAFQVGELDEDEAIALLRSMGFE